MWCVLGGEGGRTRRREYWSTCPALTGLNFIITYLHSGTSAELARNYISIFIFVADCRRFPGEISVEYAAKCLQIQNVPFSNKKRGGGGVVPLNVVCARRCRQRACAVKAILSSGSSFLQVSYVETCIMACCHKQPGKGTKREGGKIYCNDADYAGMCLVLGK